MNDKIPLPNCLHLLALNLHSSKGKETDDRDLVIWRIFFCELSIIKYIFWKRLPFYFIFFLISSCSLTPAFSLASCCVIFFYGRIMTSWNCINELFNSEKACSSLVRLPCAEKAISYILWHSEAHIFIFLETSYWHTSLLNSHGKPCNETTTLHAFSVYHLGNPEFGSNPTDARIYCSITDNNNLQK